MLGQVLRLLNNGCVLSHDSYGACTHSIHCFCDSLLPQVGKWLSISTEREQKIENKLFHSLI